MSRDPGSALRRACERCGAGLRRGRPGPGVIRARAAETSLSCCGRPGSSTETRSSGRWLPTISGTCSGLSGAPRG